MAVKPERGNLLIWMRCVTDGTEDKFSDHKSTPVTQGHKWTATHFTYSDTAYCCRQPNLAALGMAALGNDDGGDGGDHQIA